MLRVRATLHSGFDLRVRYLVSRESREFVQDRQHLEHNVGVVAESIQGSFEDLVGVHAHNTVNDTLLIATLYPLQQLDRNPLLLALYQGSHDLASIFLVQAAWLNAVDILL